MDIRSKKPDPIAQSEDQEDELLSIVSIKGFVKFSIGSAAMIYLASLQIFVLIFFHEVNSCNFFTSGPQSLLLELNLAYFLFSTAAAAGETVSIVYLGMYYQGSERIVYLWESISHPLSVDALCTLPAALPNVDTTSTVLTGSSDGYVRAVRILPTKLLGVVADHGDWPVERISIGGGMGQLSIEPEEDKNTNSSRISKDKSKASQAETIDVAQQQKWWVGSVGHDDTLRMTDLEGFFREAEQAEQAEMGEGTLSADVRDDSNDSDTEEDENLGEDSQEKPEIMTADTPEQDEGESSEESDIPQPKKRKRKAEKDTLTTMKKYKGKKKPITVERSFFDGL